MIVWIASYPRSGNRLARATLRQAFGEERVCSAASEEALRHDLAKPPLNEIQVGPDENPLPDLRRLEGPVFLKTHNLPQDIHTLSADDGVPPQRGRRWRWPWRRSKKLDSSPAIYLVRDGRDCLVSHAYYLVDLEPSFKSGDFEDALWFLICSPAPYGGWSGNVAAWRRRRAPTAIVRFEELIQDPVGTLAPAAAALGIELHARAQAPTFEELRARSAKPRLLRRGVAGSWRDEFPPHMLDAFWRRHGEQMRELGYLPE
jgi:Sulfotransferase domain